MRTLRQEGFSWQLFTHLQFVCSGPKMADLHRLIGGFRCIFPRFACFDFTAAKCQANQNLSEGLRPFVSHKSRVLFRAQTTERVLFCSGICHGFLNGPAEFVSPQIRVNHLGRKSGKDTTRQGYVTQSCKEGVHTAFSRGVGGVTVRLFCCAHTDPNESHSCP